MAQRKKHSGSRRGEKARSKNPPSQLPMLARASDVVRIANEMGLTFVRGTKNAIAVVDPSMPLDYGPVALQSMQAALEFYASKLPRVAVRNREVEGFTVWRRSPNRREAVGVGYFPDESPGTLVGDPPLLNAWCGFAVEPQAPRSKAGEKALDTYREHLFEVICNRRSDEFEYLWKWLAWVVQHPTEVPGVAPVLYSLPGTGKGQAINPLVRMHGHHGLHLVKSNSLMGKFNSLLAGRRFVYADEAAFLGDPRNRDQLKGMITEPTREIERKHIDAVWTPNILAMVMATNHHDLCIEEHDRRLFPLEVSDHRIGDRRYFRRLREATHRPDFLGALFHALLAEDLAGFHPQSHRPRTEEHRMQVLVNLPPFKRWVYERLAEGRLSRNDHVTGISGEWPETMGCTHLHRSYVTWYSTEHVRGRTQEHNPNVFGKAIRSALGIRELTRPSTGDRRERHYVMPGLAAARRAFEKCLGQSVPWDAWGEGEVHELGQRSSASKHRPEKKARKCADS